MRQIAQGKLMHLGLNFLERIKYAVVREVIVNHLARHHNHYAYRSGGLHKPDIVLQIGALGVDTLLNRS